MADVVEATEVVANAALPAATAATTYAPIAKGVTNGDSHNHDGGDGGQIAYSVLSGLPTLGTAAALNVGTAASNVVQLNGSAQLPAVDGSLLTNLPGGGGVTDHGALTGLADDDHSQYHTDARGDARYAPLAHANSTANPHSVTAAQAGADATGTAAAAVSAHAGGTSVHAIASVTGLETALSGKSPTSHDHAATYAPIANGVTNGDSHDHNGGDGGQIAYANLSGLPTLGTAAALNVGTAASNVVQLNGSAQLPAVDGSLLTGLSSGVTDHGALTGLADDDHTQYPLGAGRAGGQTISGGVAASETLTLQSTVDAAKGDITIGPITIKEGTGLIGVHNTVPAYHYDSVSVNWLAGADTGGFFRTDDTTKFFRILCAHYDNSALPIVFGNMNSQAAANQLFFGGGFTGANAATELRFYTAADTITPIGVAAMTIKSTQRVGINTTSPSCRLHIIDTAEQIRSGYDTSNYWNSNTDSSGKTIFTAVGTAPAFVWKATDATSDAVSDLATFSKLCSSGAGAAGLGVRLKLAAETSTSNDIAQGAIESEWVTATHGTRKARVKLSAYDTAIREGIRVEASGTAAMLGFFGVSAVVRPTALTTALTAITHTAPGTPDYAMQSLTAGGFGFATADEGHSALKVIANLQARVNELETKLQALGLLT